MTQSTVVRMLTKRALPVLALAAVAFLVSAPTAFGSSNGMNSENPAWPASFNEEGCTSCHGDHAWAQTEDRVSWTLVDADGAPVTSGMYEHDATYTLTIDLKNQIGAEETNQAGFYLSATAGEFQVIDGTNVQVTGGGLEASHTDATTASWTVEWVAPAEGAVAFQLLVNDADGSGAPDAGDNVYRSFFALTDSHGAQLGAAEGEHEVHYGVSLQQYWIGLIGLAGMVFIMLGAFVYLKYSNPHHTGPKDR